MRSMHTLRRSAVVATGAILALAALAPPAGATGPSGNAAAIKLYVAAAAKTSKLPYITIVDKSFYFLGYHTNGTWNMSWGYPKAPAKYEQRVIDTEIAASVGGKNVWEEDTFTYQCPAGHICVDTLTPLRFYLTKSAAYYAELTGPGQTPSCWTNATKTWVKADFDTYGDPNWYPGTSTKNATASFFDPATTVGSTTTFTSTYEYVSDQAHVTEIDSLDTTTDVFTHSNLKIGKGTGAGEGAFTWSQNILVPKGTVKPPKINRVC